MVQNSCFRFFFVQDIWSISEAKYFPPPLCTRYAHAFYCHTGMCVAYIFIKHTALTWIEQMFRDYHIKRQWNLSCSVCYAAKRETRDTQYTHQTAHQNNNKNLAARHDQIIRAWTLTAYTGRFDLIDLIIVKNNQTNDENKTSTKSKLRAHIHTALEIEECKMYTCRVRKREKTVRNSIWFNYTHVPWCGYPALYCFCASSLFLEHV